MAYKYSAGRKCSQLFLFLLIATAAFELNAQVCWKNSYGRGVGTIPGECDPEKLEKNGLLCYPKCRDGFKGVAFVCWQNCPAGFRDDGAFCAKPKPYGRGAGYALWSEGKCNRENGQGCEKCLLMYYPKCAPNFHPVGCNICSPDCPAGMKDIGVSCAKQTYTRATITPTCGQNDYNSGLCYKKCEKSYNGIGPVCWGKCPPDKPVDCGALCGASAADCASAIVDQVASVGQLIGKVASMVATLGASTGASVAGTVAEQSAVESLKALAKKLAKDIAKKFAGLAVQEIKAKLLPELKKMNIPSPLAENLANMATEPDGVNYMDVLKAIDPIGITKVVEAFKKEICQATETVNATTVDEVSQSLAKP